MLQHLKGYQKSITLIKTGRLNNKKTIQNINTVQIVQITKTISKYAIWQCDLS